MQRHFIECVFECDLLERGAMAGHANQPFETQTYIDFQLDKLSKPAYWRKHDYVSERAIYASAFDNINQAPANAFNRKQQSLIFNHVSETLVLSMPGPQQLKAHLKLLIRFLAHPNKAFNLLQVPTCHSEYSQGQLTKVDAKKPILIRIAELMRPRLELYYEDYDALELLKLLTCKVLDYQLSRPVEEQTLAYLGSYYESLACCIKGMTTAFEPNSDQRKYRGKNDNNEDKHCEEEKVMELNLYSVAVIAASLDFYRRNADKFPARLQGKLQGLPSLNELEAPISKIMYDWIDRGLADSVKPISDVCEAAVGESIFNACRAAVAQAIIATYKDLFMDRPIPSSISKCVDDLIEKVSERSQITRLSSEVISALKHVSQSVRKSQRLLAARYDVLPLEAYRKLGDRGNTIQEQKHLILTAVESIKNLGSEYSVDLIARLISPHDSGVLDRNDLLLLQSLIIRHIKTNSSSPVDASTAFSKIVNGLCDALLQPQPFQVSVLSLRCINIILYKLPRTITQFHIDQIMAVIAKSASRHPLPTSYSPKQAGLQYLALCRVFSAILAFHRKRLGGRYHLILPVLQSLLCPLFIPYRLESLPSVEAYTATCASAYSRLLLQLADPSLSSVRAHSRKSRRDQNLNDPTKIAKSIAGQHLHYLIMTYCDCQLKGRLAQGVREKLRSGIWAVLDVIPQEVMRVMNAGMDKAGRGVWKGLYEEWRRDGRGGGRGR
ncbi:MAG: hypothetical protein Q9186_005778 [Xanthomendoza sp. 1 TL-2023]